MSSPASALPPGPRMPSALLTAIWSRQAQWVMSQCARRFGQTFSLRLLHEDPWVMVSHPDHVREVFTGDPATFHAGEGNRILLPVLGEHSLLLLDERPHLRQRKLLLAPLHGERMAAYGELMGEIAREEIARWPADRPCRLRPRMQAITLEIILRAVFGVSDADRLAALRVALRRMLDVLTSPAMLGVVVLGPDRVMRVPAFRRMLEAVDDLLYAEIAQRRGVADGAQRSDILSLLLAARDEDGAPMSDRELRDELLTLLVAGHETTATALAWAVERLTRHADKLARLTAEVREGGGEYLDAVVTETLRLRPVISLVARRLTRPTEIAGRQLPAGVTVTPSIYLLHRRPDIYPDPERFMPERFLDAPPGTYTWIPFGGGVRRCIGAAFAQYEMRIVLAELVRARTLAPARAGDEPNLRRAITETPRYDAEVVLG